MMSALSALRGGGGRSKSRYYKLSECDREKMARQTKTLRTKACPPVFLRPEITGDPTKAGSRNHGGEATQNRSFVSCLYLAFLRSKCEVF